jgi:hypothetical protein
MDISALFVHEEMMLRKLKGFFQFMIDYHKVPGNPTWISQKVRITFLHERKKYSGVFIMSSKGDTINGVKMCTDLYFENNCSDFSYSYGRVYTTAINTPYKRAYPYESVIRANREEEACFEPRIEGPSTDILQIFSTKIRLQVPDHLKITIIDEAKSDGVYISKSKLLRGYPSLYEKYGYELNSNPITGEENTIKETIGELTIGTLPVIFTQLLEQKLGRKLNMGERITNVMKRISRDNEKVSYISTSHYDEEMLNDNNDDEYTPLYLSNMIYDYLASRHNFEGLILDFNEDSPKWHAIKNEVLIVGVDLIFEGGSKKRKTGRTKRRANTKKTRKARTGNYSQR